MKVLVTGGAGFIGSHVVDQYIANGYEVVVVDDLSTGRLSNLNPAATFYQLDIRHRQLDDIFAKERPDFVNHHAAQMDVRRSVAEPHFDADVNILGSINLIECARRHRVKRLIYISSGGAVYGEPEYLPCDEDHPINPICQYGASKHTVEHYLYMYAENYGLEYVVLRYPNVYGPRQDPQGEAGVVAIFIGKMLAGEQVVINGDGEQERDFVYVQDCAQANLLALTAKTPSGIYNLGMGKGTSINEIFSILKETTGYERSAIYGPPKVGETRRIYLTANKAAKDFGWSASTHLYDGMLATQNYFSASERVEPAPLYQRQSAELSQAKTRVGEFQSSEISSASGPALREDMIDLSSLVDMRDRLNHLHAFNQIMGRRSFYQAYLRRVLSLALESVDAASGSLFMLDRNGQVADVLLIHEGKVYEQSEDPQSLTDILSHGLAGWVVKHSQATLVHSTDQDPRWLKRSWDRSVRKTRSAISVPLLAQSKVVGVLTIVNTLQKRFTVEDLALLSTIAALFSIRDQPVATTVPFEMATKASSK